MQIRIDHAAGPVAAGLDQLLDLLGAHVRGSQRVQVEFREIDVPQEYYPPGGNKRESWRSLFYANLVSSFITEILSGDATNEGNFEDGAHVQELINAVELSFRERRWVSIPLAR